VRPEAGKGLVNFKINLPEHRFHSCFPAYSLLTALAHRRRQLKHLCRGSLGQLRAFQQTLAKRGTLTKKQLIRIHDKWAGISQTCDLQPYCGVIVYWVQKRLAKL